MRLLDFVALNCNVIGITHFNGLTNHGRISVNGLIITPHPESSDFQLQDGDIITIDDDTYTYKEPKPCKVCGSFYSETHHPECPEIPIEQKIRDYDYYVQLCNKLRRELVAAHDKSNEKITLWQGKFAIVKEENNALRKKLYG